MFQGYRRKAERERLRQEGGQVRDSEDQARTGGEAREERKNSRGSGDKHRAENVYSGWTLLKLVS